MSDSWISSQNRTMTKWVNSKIPVQINNLAKDLGDGLVLVQLINRIIQDTQSSSYFLTPLYKKPVFALQKMENVDDVLKFCRLVLKVNICNICAEDVVGGNVKLILGLLWSLFMFASSKLIFLKNNAKSFTEIKTILLAWLNGLGKKKALAELTNFSKDWSLQQEKRPDLIFAAILDFYSPNSINFRQYMTGKPVESLTNIMSLASTKFGIPELMIVDDFNVLIPDERSVLLYLLEWYVSLENSANHSNCDGSSSETDLAGGNMDSFFDSVIKMVKLKNKYDTRSLRLLNQINAKVAFLSGLQKKANSHLATCDIQMSISDFCADFVHDKPISDQIIERMQFAFIADVLNDLESTIITYESYRLGPKCTIINKDFPELRNLTRELNSELKQIGLKCAYEPLKVLSLQSLNSKLEVLLETEKKLCVLIEEVLSEFLASKVTCIEALLKVIENSLSTGTSAPSSTPEYVFKLESLLQLHGRMSQYKSTLVSQNAVVDLKVLTESNCLSDPPNTSEPPDESQYATFQRAVANEKNQSNKTFSETKCFLKKMMSKEQFEGPVLHTFIRLIPTRTLLGRSDSDYFGDIVPSDDSDDSETIFDKVSRDIEGRLTGTFDKLFNLSLLIERMENGFQV